MEGKLAAQMGQDLGETQAAIEPTSEVIATRRILDVPAGDLQGIGNRLHELAVESVFDSLHGLSADEQDARLIQMVQNKEAIVSIDNRQK